MMQACKPSADYCGIAVAALCVGDCLILPLLVALLPGLLPENPESLVLHLGLVTALVGCAVLSFVPGLRRHGVAAVAIGGATGVLLLGAGTLAHHLPLLEGMGTLLSTTGGIVTIGAHLVNLHLCQPDSPVARESAVL